MRLDFRPNDIKYIIVQEEKNREKIIEAILKSIFFQMIKLNISC